MCENPKSIRTNTLIVVILDESGSMTSKKSDVLGGFNNFLDQQKKVETDDARLVMVKFNTLVSVLHSNVPLRDVPHLTDLSYSPGGATALYDAVAEGVRLAEKNKMAHERVLVLIMTDGEENSSRETTKKQVAEIIRAHEALGDWTFAYIGENPERWASEMQRNALGNVKSYNHREVYQNFESLSLAVETHRCSPAKQSNSFFRTPPPK